MVRLEPVHPGEVLKRDFMESFGLSATALAKAIGVTPARINEIVHGRRGITAATALDRTRNRSEPGRTGVDAGRQRRWRASRAVLRGAPFMRRSGAPTIDGFAFGRGATPTTGRSLRST